MRFTFFGAPLQVIALLTWASAQGAELRSTADQRDNLASTAASFDCMHAASSQEKLICGDPALSALDGQLGNIYRERRARLSPQGVQLLEGSERNWLRFIATVCSPNNSSDDPRRDARDCLQQQYGDRIQQLQTVGQRIGPFVFNNVDLFAAEPAEGDDGAISGFYIQHVAYPQIDNANSRELIAWNRQNVRNLSTKGDCGSSSGDYSTDYEIGYANTRLISVSWRRSTYCHGTPHGFWGVKTENAVLLPHLRPLSERDVFGTAGSWVTTLQDRFWATLLQTGWSPLENQSTDEIKHGLEEDFIQPDKWLFTREGLQVSFSAYEGGCYACTPRPITVPWSTLKPLLSPTAIVP